MRPDIHDLRLLKMAAFYEQAHERFALDVARRVTQDAQIQRGLERLARSSDAQRHAVADLMQERATTLTPQDHQELVVAALLAVRDMSRNAHDLYWRLLDEAHDEAVATLFRSLRRETERHLRLADELVYRAQRTRADGHGRDTDPHAEGLQHLHDLEVMIVRPRRAAVGEV